MLKGHTCPKLEQISKLRKAVTVMNQTRHERVMNIRKCYLAAVMFLRFLFRTGSSHAFRTIFVSESHVEDFASKFANKNGYTTGGIVGMLVGSLAPTPISNDRCPWVILKYKLI